MLWDEFDMGGKEATHDPLVEVANALSRALDIDNKEKVEAEKLLPFSRKRTYSPLERANMIFFNAVTAAFERGAIPSSWPDDRTRILSVTYYEHKGMDMIDILKLATARVESLK